MLKKELLIKIRTLEMKGYKFNKYYTIDDDYDEMKFEYEVMRHQIDKQLVEDNKTNTIKILDEIDKILKKK